MKKFFSALMLMMLCAVSSQGAVTITKTQAWFEGGYVTWTPVAGQTYTVSVKATADAQWTTLDNELVRNYGTYGRADALGLKSGVAYQFKVVASNGDEVLSEEFTPRAYDRTGFAHKGRTEGVGAYNNDGTLKANAKVIYVYANNAKTVKASILHDKAETEFTGIQSILDALEKGTETAPINIRIIGTIKKADLDHISSSAEGIQIKGKNGSTPMNITVEGVGDDATIHGFGLLIRNVNSGEFRNFASMLCMDDCLSLDTDNHYIWIHNMDFFYGGTGSASDQAKGDGTVDIKGKSSEITVSYNHFWDSGKSSLGGMKSETTSCKLTYHHNWFDHSDSRHPRIRTMSFHIYNNYFDGNSKYGVGMTMGGSAFVEKNYFRNCKYPMMISKQGTDATGDGTFSGEAGGVIKSFDNYIFNPRRYYIHKSSTGTGVDHNGNKAYSKDNEDENDWDSYEVASATEQVPATVVCGAGGTGYNNFDQDLYNYTPDAAADVKAIVMNEQWGAGRQNTGDFDWTFNNATQDENYGVITALKQELIDYKSSLVGFFSGVTSINNGGYTGGRSGGDSQKNEDYIATYGGGGSDDSGEAPDGTQAYVSSFDVEGDYYWFTEDNDPTTNIKLINDGVITLTDGTYSFTPDAEDDNKYGLTLKKETGAVVFYCSTGIPYFAVKVYRTGSLKGTTYYSNDGTTYTKLEDYSTKKKGTYGLSFSTKENGDGSYPKYVKFANTASGGLSVQGIKIYTIEGGTPTVTKVEPTDDNNAKATVTLDGEVVPSQSYTKNIEFEDNTASYTIVVTPEVVGATVTATSLAIPVEGQTNTWTVAAPEKISKAKVNVKFTVTSRDGSTSKVYSISIQRGEGDDGSYDIYNFKEDIGTTDGTTGSPAEFTAKTSFKLGGNAQYIIIKPKSGDVFKNGDQVTITGSVGSDNKTVGLCYAPTATRDTNSAIKAATTSSKNTATTVEGTLTLSEDASELYLYRYEGTATTITSVIVRRPATTGIMTVTGENNTSAFTKYLKNGRMIIQKADKLYNVSGQILK